MPQSDNFFSRHLPWIVAVPPLVLIAAYGIRIVLGYDGLCRGTESATPCAFLPYLAFRFSHSDPANLAALGYIGLLVAAWLAVWFPVLMMRRRS
jgi:hypothetical protein